MIPLRSLLSLATVVAALAPESFAQSSRPQQQVDPGGVNPYQHESPMIVAEGQVVVAAWLDRRDPVNTSKDDVYFAVSLDGGLTFSGDYQATDLASAGNSVDQFGIAVSLDAANPLNSVLHLAWQDDTVGSYATHYSRLAPLGAAVSGSGAWSSPMTITSSSSYTNIGLVPRVYAAGNDVLLIHSHDPDSISSGDPRALYGRWSDDRGASFGTSHRLVPSTWETVHSTVPFHVAMEEDEAVVVFRASETALTSGYGALNTYAVRVWQDPGSGTVTWESAERLDNAPAGDGVVLDEPRVARDGAFLFAVWREQDRTSGAGVEVYSNWSEDGGVTWETERLASTVEVWDCDIDVDGTAVGVVYSNFWTSGDLYTREWDASAPGGGDWDTEVHHSTVEHVLDPRIFVQGGMRLLSFSDERVFGGSVRNRPYFAWSNDAGANWSDPLASGEGWGSESTVLYTDGSVLARNNLLALYYDNGGTGGSPSMQVVGIRHPFLTVTTNPGSLTVDFEVYGIDTSLVGTGFWARLAMSSATTAGATMPFGAPRLDLVSDPFLAATTSLPYAASLAGPVLSDGTFSLTLGYPAILSSIPMAYWQAWTVVALPGSPSTFLRIDPASDVGSAVH